MRHSWFLACLLPFLGGQARAQDVLLVTSPNGQIEFRIFVTQPAGAVLNTLAYQVSLRGKPLLDTSYLSLNIHFQEPLLGENVGLSKSKVLHEGNDYKSLYIEYWQTSTTGRRFNFEVRVSNDGVAFRYIVPPSALLMNLLIEDEDTEFRFARRATGERPKQAALPYTEQEPEVGWVGIFETPVAGFPPMQLVRTDASTMTSHLPQKPHDPGVAFEGKTPFTGPWRIVAIGPDRDRLAQSALVRDLLGK
jgi:hypothetical protein